MFGFSFWEVFILLVVALIVIGPERLPGVARKAGEWTYKVRKFVANAKAEMDSEFNMQDMKQLLNSQESEISKLRAMVEETRHDIDQTGDTVKSALDDAEQTMHRSAESEKARASDKSGGTKGEDAEASRPEDDAPSHLKAIDQETSSSYEDELERLSSETGERFHRPFASTEPEETHSSEEEQAEPEKPETGRRDHPKDQ
ncbi:MAG: Sec-independent protein translocase protein TatB [Pseudomonadota bacterium]